jgi:Uma2 family endonuclease
VGHGLGREMGYAPCPMQQQISAPYAVDPDDPRAPPQTVWDAMTPEERASVVAALPADVPIELHPPEGDRHRVPKDGAREALRSFFRKLGRRIYVSSELATYYPNEPRFCPDVLAVLDVDDHARDRWAVGAEGKGLDLVLEVHVWADSRKDYELNVERYARLGIAEYFLLDVRRASLVGWRLVASGGVYERVVPQGGKLPSRVLGLDLAFEDDRVRFYYGTAPLPEANELVEKLDRMVADISQRREEEGRLRQQVEEQRDAEVAARKQTEEQRDAEVTARKQAEEQRDALARELEQARAELALLRKGG